MRMADKLSSDLLYEILIRLPVKSILQFRSVCKSWKNLIQDPSFIKAHTQKVPTGTHISRSSHFVLRRPCGEFSLRCSETLAPEMALHPPPQVLPIPKNYCVGGSCRGLICLFNQWFSPCPGKIVLWNPMLMKYKSLPFPNTYELCLGTSHVVLGLGYVSGTHRVVQIISNTNLGPEEQCLVQVFDLSLNSWRVLACDVPGRINVQSSDVSVNGALHWTGITRDDNKDIIVSFDMKNEVFGVIKMPNCYLNRPYIAVLGESLAMVTFYYNDLQIWVMNEYGVEQSWAKYLRIEQEWERLAFSIPGFLRNGKFLIQLNWGEDSEIILYDPITRITYNCLDIHGVCDLIPHVQSLALLDAKDEDFRQDNPDDNVYMHWVTQNS